MPVDCNVELRLLEREDFHAADKVVMKHSLDIHNTLGRFCDERIYQAELTGRCRGEGIDVHQEVLLRVFYKEFSKPYYLDMLINRGSIYELKAVKALGGSHESQLINYLLLGHLKHGKLINFRPGSVESRFVSTSLSYKDRLNFNLIEDEWIAEDLVSIHLREVLLELLGDWGTFLDVSLYREALLFFSPGSEAGVQPVEIKVSGRLVGSQKMYLLDSETAWHLSAVRQHLGSYQTHLTRLLQHMELKRIQWINLNQRDITFKTLNKGA